MIRSNGKTRDDLTIVGASIYRELRLAVHPAEPAQPNNNFLCPVICLFGEGRSCLACRGRRVRSHTKGQGAGRQYRRPPDAVAKGCRRTKLGEARPWASGRNGGDEWVRRPRCRDAPWIGLELRDAAAEWPRRVTQPIRAKGTCHPGIRRRRRRFCICSGNRLIVTFSLLRRTDTQGSAHQRAELSVSACPKVTRS